MGEHGFFDKRLMYEESLRMPFVIRYPREVQAGQRLDDIVLNVDFPVLFADYAGLSRPDFMQGRSFRQNLQGQTPADWRGRCTTAIGCISPYGPPTLASETTVTS